MSSGDYDKCMRAIRDLVKVVASCPRSKQEWDNAASNKNCNQIATNALCKTSNKPYFYHCVINGFRNATLEVCKPRKVIFGYCTEYNVAGGVIQRQKSAKCNNAFPKCDNFYNSTEAFKYPDCYELVHKKQDSNTTAVPQDERTTSKPDHGNNLIFYVTTATIALMACVAPVFLLYFKKYRRSTANEENESYSLLQKEQSPSIKYFYIKAKHFKHFHYLKNLAKDCELRLKKTIRGENRRKNLSDKDVLMKDVGNLTEDNLNLLSKVEEEKIMPGEMLEISLGAAPLLCFQNDLQSESALEILRRENAPHKNLVHSDVPFDKTCKADGSIIIVGQNKRQITSCLEEQLDQMLQDWLENHKHEDLNKQTSEIIAEIEAIRKQLILDTSHNTVASDAPSFDSKSIVPNDVKDYLLRRYDVNGFGIWGCSTFRIFVNEATDEKILKEELIKLDQSFFETYQLTIVKRNREEKHTMRQYDSTSLM